MVECALCSFKGGMLAETSLVAAALPEKPVVPGHAIVFPKSHFQILEQVPDDVVSELFEVSNRLSTAMFDALKSQGTNIILMNGLAAGQRIPHLAVNVIPRARDDGLGFSWPSRKLSDEQMGLIEAQVREQLASLGSDGNPTQEGLEEFPARPDEGAMPVEEPAGKDSLRKPREDIFTRQLRRMP